MPPNDPYQPTPQSPHYRPRPGDPQYGQQPLPPATNAPPEQPQPYNPNPDYGFIMDATQEKKPAVSLPTVDSKIKRIGIVAGGLLILLILFAIFRSILSGSANFDPLISAMQDQQALVQIVSNAQNERSISIDNKNFAITAQLGLNSDQQQFSSYLAKNDVKVDPKILALKITPETETRLKDAAQASTYNRVFQEVMQDQLATYQQNLQSAYAKLDGANGKALLSKSYEHASLLSTQLKAASSTGN